MPAMDLAGDENDRMLAEHRFERLAPRRIEVFGGSLEDLLRVCRDSGHQCRVDAGEPQPEGGTELAPLAFKKAFRIAAELHATAQPTAGNCEPSWPRANSPTIPRS